MKITIDIDELKNVAENVFNGCVQLLALIDGKEGERLRHIEELKKTRTAK